MSELEQQLKLMDNPFFNVNFIGRVEGAETGRANIKWDYDLTIEQVLKLKNALLGKNKKGCDIYVKPSEKMIKNYSVLVDDLTKEKLEELLKTSSPNFVLFSSNNNFQAVFMLSVKEYTKAQADFIVKKLGNAFGDSVCSGSNHFMRLATFHNKKPKNQNELVKLVDFQGLGNNKAFFEDILKEFKPKQAKEKNYSVGNTQQHSEELTEEQQKLIKREIFAETAFCNKQWKNNLDLSVIDFRIVQRLYKKGFSASQIEKGFRLFTENYLNHPNPDDYLNRTIEKGIAKVENG